MLICITWITYRITRRNHRVKLWKLIQSIRCPGIYVNLHGKHLTWITYRITHRNHRAKSGAPTGIRKVRKCVPSNFQNLCCKKPLSKFPLVTAIKTFVDGYNLRLISRRCIDQRHYGAMVRSGLSLSGSTDPSWPLLNIAVKHPNRQIGLILNALWRETLSVHRHHPRPSDSSTCHRPSVRWVNIYIVGDGLHMATMHPPPLHTHLNNPKYFGAWDILNTKSNVNI